MNIVRTVFFCAVLTSFALTAPAQDFQVESYQGKDAVAGEILVRFRGVTTAQSQAITAQDADIALTQPVGQSGAVLLRSRRRSVPALLQAYRSRLDVEYAEPNYVWKVSDLPNDALFPQQWALRNTGQTMQGVQGFADVDIKARQAWDITEGSRGVVVGVLDTGVDYTHPDLRANMWSAPQAFTVRINGKLITCAAGTHGFNAITRECDPLDDNGHGTHVAGIVGASGNNGSGVSGVSRIASIMALKFLGANGNGTTLDAIAAIDFALQVKTQFPVETNIRALNNSWGGGAFSQALLDEIRLLDNANVLFVAAAGNAALNNDLSAYYPTNYVAPNVMSVAATDNRDLLASFSDWGPTAVDLAAPGVSVLSTIPGGLYGFNDGTSMATPMVTGAAALVLSVCPLTTAGVKANLLASVDEVPALADRVLTAGRLNVFRALSNCVSSPAPGFALTVSPGVQSLDPNGSARLTVTAAALGGFSGVIDLSAPVLPTGLTATFDRPSIAGGAGTSTLTVRSDASATLGTNAMVVVGSSGNLERRAGVSIDVGLQVHPIGLNQTVAGALSSTDRQSQGQIGSYADYYRLTLPATTAVTIDLKAGLFDAYLYLLSSAGTVLSSSDNVVVSNPRITATLGPGVYMIEATSASDGQVGGYTLSVNTPTLSALTPRTISPGTTATVLLTGTRFTSPMAISAGTDITVSNLTVVTSTSATATLTVDVDAIPGPRDITVSTAEGVSNPMALPIPTRIQPGQSIAGSISTTDLVWPNTLFRYTDLYQLTLNAPTAVTLDVRSTGFDALIGLFSASGAILVQDDDGAGINADRIAATLDTGTYYVEVTSASLGGTSGDYAISVNLPGLNAIAPRFIEAGTSTPITLLGSRLLAPLTVDAGNDIVVSNTNVVSATLATAIATSNSMMTGNRSVTASTPAGSTNPVSLRVVPQIPSVDLGETIVETLSSTDPLALDVPGAYMDLYRFTLATSTRITFDLQSDAIDMNLILLNSSGLPFSGNNDSNGGRNASLTTTLGAGTYFAEVTSSIDGQSGDYTFSLAPVVLGLASISPRFGVAGTTFTANLSGVGLSEPITVDAGQGITVSDVAIQSSTAATVTFTIAANAVPGMRDITLSTPFTVSIPLNFTVHPTTPIAVGETKNGFLSSSDVGSANRPGNYGDLFRLTLTSPASVSIAMNSTAFNAFTYLMTSDGTVVESDDISGGGGNARIAAVLDAGTYLIDATSATAGVGDYTVTVSLTPTLLSFPRALTPAELALTEFAVVNPGASEANVRFTMYDSAGTVVSTATETVAAGGQMSKLGGEIFQGVDRNGWVQATSDSVGLEALWMGGDFTNRMDGGRAAPETVDLLFPLITPQTELNIVNVGPGLNLITLVVTNASGALVAVGSRTLPANGVFRATVSTLFPGLTTAASVRITGTQRMIGTSITPDYPVGPSMTVLNAVNAAAASSTVYFPHVISGGGWTSILGVANVSTTLAQQVTMTFTPATGSPISVSRILAPRATLRESVQTLFSLFGTQEGWIRVNGTSTVTAYVAFGFAGTSGATTVPGQDTARTALLFEQVATGPDWGTGLALVNPSPTTDASVRVYVLSKTGTLVGRNSLLLSRGTKMSRLLTEMIPDANADDGFIYVESTIPIYGMELLFSRDLRTISNVVPGGPDPGIVYVPPTP